jgi:hypothetical protein
LRTRWKLIVEGAEADVSVLHARRTLSQREKKRLVKQAEDCQRHCRAYFDLPDRRQNLRLDCGYHSEGKNGSNRQRAIHHCGHQPQADRRRMQS